MATDEKQPAVTVPKLAAMPFPVQSAAMPDPSGTKETLINLYAQEAPKQGRSSVLIRNTPGLALSQAYGLGPVKMINTDLPGSVFVVSGERLYKTTNPGGVSKTIDMGYIGTPTTTGAITPFISIAVGPTHVVVCVQPYAYAASATDTMVHRIQATSDGTMPSVTSVAYVGGYYVFTVLDSSQFFSSSALDPDTYNALDFAFSDKRPNIILRAESHLGLLWLMGQGAVEVWSLSGSGDFPFAPEPGGVIDEDVISGLSVAKVDSSLFWLSGTGIVFRQSGYKATRISTDSIESQIQAYANMHGGLSAALIATAFEFVYEGHTFYALTLQSPGDSGVTWVYDCATALWHNRSSSMTGVGRWRVNCAASAGSYLLGDSYSGYLFSQSEGVSDDAGMPANRIAIAPPSVSTERVFMSRLEVECQLQQQPIKLDWSDDDGATWSTPRIMSVTGKRAYTTRLGSYYRRTNRLSTTGTVRLYSINAVQTGSAS